MKNDTRKLQSCRIFLGVLTASTSLYGFAHAQTSSSAASALNIDEIVVTATKRTISVQDVPLAVSAIGGDALQQSNIANITALSALEPSLQIQSKGAGDTQIIIRGIQSAGASLVSVYVDEAVVTGSDFNGSGGRQSSVPFYDVERVEILKGPQGTLFGSGSMAGSVRLIAKKPVMNEYSFDITASAETGKGVNELYETHAVANIPVITDELAVRVTAWATEGGGYLDRAIPRTIKNSNDQHIQGIRGILEWRPSSDFKLTATALTQSIDVGDVDYFRRNSGAYNIGVRSMGEWDENYNLYSLVGDYSLPFGSITAATSYSQRKILTRADTTPISSLFGLPDAYQINEYQDRALWSSEVRFSSDFDGPFQLVTGLFYQEDRDGAENVIGRAGADGNLGCVLYGDCSALGANSEVIFSRSLQHDVDQFAIFAQGDYDLTDTITATVGIRYYEATLNWSELSNQNLRPSHAIPPQAGPIVTLDDKSKQNNTSYNFSLGWRPTDDLSFYARVASGFRLGGINTLSSRQLDPSVPVGYNSDTLWNYEVGAKMSFFDRRLIIDSALYLIEWTGQQVSAITASGVTSYMTNAGSSKVQGVELQVTARPIEGLTANWGITYTNSKLTEDQPTAATNPAAGRDGDRVPLVPRWSWAGQIRYEVPISDTNSVYAHTSFNYRGRAYTDFHTSNTYMPLESYFRADASVGVILGSWDVNLFVKNLTNEVAQIGLVPLTGVVTPEEASVATIRPRTFGIKVSTGF